MTVEEAVRAATQQLKGLSSSPRLDAEVLLAHVLGVSRSSLLAHPNDALTPETARAFTDLVDRRKGHEPIAYLVGHREFYGLDLDVDRSVLIPRPETESVVDACLEALPAGEISQMADVGTGSGAIAVAVAAKRPLCTIYATEISADALDVARRNAEKHHVAGRIRLLPGNLLDPLPGPVNVIAANLPYVAPEEAEPDVALWEPHVAVFGGGDDGTSTIRAFLKDAPSYLLPGGTVVMETAYSQGQIVKNLAEAAFPKAHIEVRKDLSGYDRIVVIRTS